MYYTWVKKIAIKILQGSAVRYTYPVRWVNYTSYSHKFLIVHYVPKIIW